MTSFYELRMLNKMSQYSIKINAQNMLKAHDDWKTGKIDEAEMGRRIRLSPENRAAVIQTMVKIAGIMQKKPEESKYVLAIIEICGEIVSIADKPPPSTGFPSFLKLPSEIRHRIYDFYLKPGPAITMIPYKKKATCPCAPHEPPHSILKRDISLAFASKEIRDEVLAYFYKINTIFFSCACEMGEYLRSSAFMRQHVRKIKFQWWGRNADKGISELRNCSVESLTVVVARMTMREPSKREKSLRKHFIRLRIKPSFPEALGFEELSALRGFQKVDVELAHKKRTADVCTMEERVSLFHWLQQLKEHA